MRTRDDLKAMVEALRGGHSLLAAYLEAVHAFDRQALGKAAAIVDVIPDANPVRPPSPEPCHRGA